MPRICFFGEAPGADEDRSGRPFVGAAGQLLDRIIQASGLKREEVYILNTVKCRPPENRNPTDQEIAQCRGYFESQFEILRPEFIVCLGLVAAKSILKDAPSIGRLRGRLHRYRGAQVIVTYHPSYLLRTPSAKGATWEDMKMLLTAMGLPIPSKS
jgi:DNA polymerase